AFLDAALQIARADAAIVERAGDALADLAAVYAIHHRQARSRKGLRPRGYGFGLATQRAADHFDRRPERRRAPDIDHEGRLRRMQRVLKLGKGDRCVHRASSRRRLTRRDRAMTPTSPPPATRA